MFRSAAVLLLSASLAVAAPLATIERTVDVTAPAAWTVPLMHGETMRIRINLRDGRGPLFLPAGVNAQFLWQTNGMATAYWTRPANVTTGGVATIDWQGVMDTGADRANAFLAVFDAATNRLYTSQGTLRFQPSPGYVPNTLPLPVEEIDFAAVAVTNAPWATMLEVDAHIAEATNNIPAPDLSAYLRKDGGTMSDLLSFTNSSTSGWAEIGASSTFGGGYFQVVGDNGDETDYQCNGVYLSGTAGSEGMILFPTVSGNETFALFRDIPSVTNFVARNGDTMSGTLRIIKSGGAAGLVVSNSVGTPRITIVNAGGGRGDIRVSESSRHNGNFYLPDLSGDYTLAVVGQPYADPAPWSLSSAMVAPQSAADTYCVTNGDAMAEYVRQGSYTDAQFVVEIEDRPAEYAYVAPTGTWSIVSDPNGAASGISADGYLSSSRTNSGSVVVEYATPTNGTKTSSVFLTQSARNIKVRDGIDFAGTFRWTCGTNVLAVYDAVDYSGAYHTTTNPYSTGETEKILDALCPYNTFGRNIPTASNPTFCWRGLMASLLCVSVQKTEMMGIRGQQILAVSPHFAVAAKHFGEVPPSTWTEVFCTDYESGVFVQVHCTNPRIGNPANDIALIRFTEALPPQCIAKLLRPEDAERLSPSLFKGAVGINYTQHGSIVPFHVGSVSMPWTIPDYDNATNAVHVGHVGDSGHAYGMVTPRLQFIPLGCLTTPNGGPSLIDADNQQWIATQLAQYGEELTYWTMEDLTNE